MKQPYLIPFFCLVGAAVACGGGDDGGGGGGGGGSDRGGPDSLIGFNWEAEPFTINGIEFEFGFMFDRTTTFAENTCNGSLTASTSAPVRYRYSATVSNGDSTTVGDGGSTCFVEIAAASFDFEIIDSKLVVTYQGQTIEFSPSGTVAGLYGKWTAAAPGVGTLTWSMGNGEIEATTSCDNGLSATTVVGADFVNKLEITEEASDTVTDEFGLECSVSIAAGMSTYHFDGDTLVLVTNGEEVRLTRN